MNINSVDVVNKFVQFFQKNTHYFHPHGPLLSSGDDSTMFTIAGMKQFTDIFMGIVKPDHTKVITVQPCIRVNDLDIIGTSAFHHSFFEMLGSFSFNDYFKGPAITMAYEFLFKELNINLDYVYFTVHTNDTEAYNLWKNIVDESRIILSDQNIWKAGKSGPCGYCSEIFYDRDQLPPTHKDIVKAAIENSDQRFLEIWNLVFMEFQCTNDELKPLGRQSIDSGMGLERLCSVVSGTFDTYKTDLIKPMVDISGSKIVADHSRAILFLCSEGLKPNADGRSYVLRKLIRRCFVNVNLEILEKTIEMAHFIYSARYNHLNLQETLEVIKDEFELFNPILLSAQEKVQTLEKINEESLFYLHETHGIPMDVTIPMAIKMNYKIDYEKIESLMELHKDRSNRAIAVDYNIPTKIECYDKTKTTSKIKFIDEKNNIIVTENSCFYGKSGGQMGDQGIIYGENFRAKVIDTLKQAITDDTYIVLHMVEIEMGKATLDLPVTLEINEDLRRGHMRAHSTVHILGEILLKKVNGSMAGSSVENDSFHFDVESLEAVKPHIKEAVEETNDIIRQAINTKIYLAKRDQLLSDILFLKTANYANEVRVVEFGNISKQLCGGTHVLNTGALGVVIITKETAVKKNIRRIYGLCGKKALDYLLASLESKNTEEKGTKDIKPKEFYENIGGKFIWCENMQDNEMVNLLTKENIGICILKTEHNVRFLINREKIGIDIIKNIMTHFNLNGVIKDTMKIIRLGSTNIITKEKILEYLQ